MTNKGRNGLSFLIVGVLVLCFAHCMSSCTTYPAQQYEYVTSPTGVQMVRCYDGGSSFLMEVAAFNMLMNSGGYTNVVHHYHVYPSSGVRYDSRVYSNWQTMPRNYRPAPYSQPSRPPFYPQQPRTNGFRSNVPPIAPRTYSPSTPRSNGFRSSPPTRTYNTRSGGFRSRK